MTSVVDPVAPNDPSQPAAPSSADAAQTLLDPAAPTLGASYVGRKYLQLVLVLGALSAIGPLTIDTYLPALPRLTADLAATDAQAQGTITGLLVGLGLGQLLIGPLSDAVGRRKPLLIGLVSHAVASALCAIAPSIVMLTITRSFQGLSGAAVAVVSMAMVRDLFRGIRAAQLLSRLVLVIGVSPILAPSLGSLLLKWTSWRGIFVVLAGLAVALLVLAIFALPETLPRERRISARPRASIKAYLGLFSDRLFIAMIAIAGMMFSTTFTYVSGSSFVFQDIFKLTPGQYGVIFGINGVGLILMTQLNPIFVKRFGPVRVLTVAIAGSTAAGIAMSIVAILGGGLVALAIPLWFVIAAAGLAMPNSPAIALHRHGEAAGTAAALLGSSQFVLGGLVAPLVGVFSNGTAVPMAVLMASSTGVALLLLLSVRRRLLEYSYD